MKNVIILSAVFIMAGQSYMASASAGESPSQRKDKIVPLEFLEEAEKLNSVKSGLSININEKLIRKQAAEIKRCSPLDNQLMQRAFELDERRLEKLKLNPPALKQTQKVPDAELLFALDSLVDYIDSKSCIRPLLTSFAMLKYLRFLETNEIGKLEDKNWYWLDKRERINLYKAARNFNGNFKGHLRFDLAQAFSLKDIFPEEHEMLYPEQYETIMLEGTVSEDTKASKDEPLSDDFHIKVQTKLREISKKRRQLYDTDKATATDAELGTNTK